MVQKHRLRETIKITIAVVIGAGVTILIPRHSAPTDIARPKPQTGTSNASSEAEGIGARPVKWSTGDYKVLPQSNKQTEMMPLDWNPIVGEPIACQPVAWPIAQPFSGESYPVHESSVKVQRSYHTWVPEDGTWVWKELNPSASTPGYAYESPSTQFAWTTPTIYPQTIFDVISALGSLASVLALYYAHRAFQSDQKRQHALDTPNSSLGSKRTEEILHEDSFTDTDDQTPQAMRLNTEMSRLSETLSPQVTTANGELKTMTDLEGEALKNHLRQVTNDFIYLINDPTIANEQKDNAAYLVQGELTAAKHTLARTDGELRLLEAVIAQYRELHHESNHYKYQAQDYYDWE